MSGSSNSLLLNEFLWPREDLNLGLLHPSLAHYTLYTICAETQILEMIACEIVLLPNGKVGKRKLLQRSLMSQVFISCCLVNWKEPLMAKNQLIICICVKLNCC